MKLDDFEAVFRSSVKDTFTLEPPKLEQAVLLSDLPADRTEHILARVQGFLGENAADVEWEVVRLSEDDSVPTVIGALQSRDPDLVCGYRHLLGGAKELPHSLGSTVDTLTQATSYPILLLPPPTRERFDEMLYPLERVLVITDHAAGDDRLANWGVRMCPRDGVLYLAHVEDELTFTRYTDILHMIRDIDPDVVCAELSEKLLGRARYYIDSISEVLAANQIQETVTPIVTMGRELADHRRIIDENQIQLAVLNTKDEHQLAMHGMAYAIAVEIQYCPLLLL